MKNKITDLRDHLFLSLERLNDMETPVDIDRETAIAQIASVLVNSAKVEVDAMSKLNIAGSDFLQKEQKAIS